jgi:hypothetical protein
VKPKLQGQAPPAASAPISIRPAASAGSPSVRIESPAALNSTSPSQAIPANQNGPSSGTSPAAGSFGTSPLATSPASGSPSSPFSKGRSCGHADCKKKLPLTAVACRCGNMCAFLPLSRFIMFGRNSYPNSLWRRHILLPFNLPTGYLILSYFRQQVLQHASLRRSPSMHL